MEFELAVFTVASIAALIIIFLLLSKYFKTISVDITGKTKKIIESKRINGETYEETIRRMIGGN